MEVKNLLENAVLTRMPDPTIIDNLMGPHEWGYRDPTDGSFTADKAPYAAGEYIQNLERWLAEAGYRKVCASCTLAGIPIWSKTDDCCEVCEK